MGVKARDPGKGKSRYAKEGGKSRIQGKINLGNQREVRGKAWDTYEARGGKSMMQGEGNVGIQGERCLQIQREGNLQKSRDAR